MWKIKKDLLLDAINSAQNYSPNEFLCFLGGDKKTEIVTEIVFLPTQTSKNSASISEQSIPFDETIVGTLHSHPLGSNHPSKQDIRFFRRYNINCVLGHPFSIENIGFYNEKGEKTTIIID